MGDPETSEMPAEFETAGDDVVVRFQTERAGTSGRLIRLGQAVDTILTRHNYPEPVSMLLGEAVALTAMLGAALKFDGKLILQTKSDGPVDFLVVHFDAPGKVRGYARYDGDRLSAEASKDGEGSGALMGYGHLAMTIDPGPEMDRYQGVVPLEGGKLSEAADTYFRQSEQLPTFLRLAVAKHYIADAGEDDRRWTWRAGGLMIQNLSREGGRPYEAAGDHREHDIWPFVEEDEDWNRICQLAATVEDHELLDPMLSAERLLYRLFHEEQVRAFQPDKIKADCGCSRERVHKLLRRFPAGDMVSMLEDGMIRVTCEFCNTPFHFSPSEIE
ncbi:33 kDa chaperonin [bacterium MnTg02]|nr:33 kDa chaperonin [bacterium MnTg02]